MTEQIESALQQRDFDLAAELYLKWYEETPEDFTTIGKRSSRARVTHITNAANLARMLGYQKLHFVEGVSPRLGDMVRALFGLIKPAFISALQRPTFMYIPQLKSKPFYNVQDFKTLQAWIQSLAPFKGELLALGRASKHKYVDEFKNLPKSREWEKLKEDWLSSHLIKGGEYSNAFNALSEPLRLTLVNAPLAYCPPHSPEMFVSVLEPGAYIPPHYGISNCKLTVHIPLNVSDQASLTAGEEVFCWSENQEAMIFDDSFLHSAKNESNEVRVVLIFDIWHPDLSLQEKEVLVQFMKKYTDWNKGVGKLANLDAQLRRQC